MTDNNIEIAAYFRLNEFECPCCQAVRIRPELLNRLVALRECWGRIVITSGYRCDSHNAEVGGKPSSLHKVGAAADVAVIKNLQESFCHLAAQMGLRAIAYPNRGFVHLDILECLSQ